MNSRSVTRNKQEILAILHFIHLIHPQEPQERVEDPYAATTAWHHLLMLVTNLVTHCCGMAFHSSTKSRCRSAIVVVLVTNTYSTPKLISKVFTWVEVWTHGRPFHFLYSHILEVVCDNPGSVGVMDVILEDGVRSQIVEIWDHPRPQPN